VALLSGAHEGVMGQLAQTLSAALYRGSVVRFRAAVRVNVLTPASGARLSLEVGLPGGTKVREERSLPIASAEWREYELVLPVDARSESIRLVLTFYGRGEAFLDAASVDIAGPAGVGHERPRPLDRPALANLVAFARLLGYIRYFHPSDQAAATDWHAFAVDGVSAVEKAQTPGELAAILSALFGPIAPAVVVTATARAASATDPTGKASGSGRVIRWVHWGLGNESSLHGSPYQSRREKEPGFIASLFGRVSGSYRKDPRAPDKPFSADLGAASSRWRSSTMATRPCRAHRGLHCAGLTPSP
jgi:hypothetical protein